MKIQLKKVCTLIITVVIILTCAATAFAIDEPKLTGANWMSTLPDSKIITSINIPGTHDSATQNISFEPIIRTQSLSIVNQLNAGVRYLDIRLEKKGDEYISVHGIIPNKKDCGAFSKTLKADDIIADCSEFLRSNPGETILMFVKEDNGYAGFDFYTQFYNKYVKNNDMWYVENRIPTLGEVRGKIVLLRCNELDKEIFDDTNCGISFMQYPYIPEEDTINFWEGRILSVDGKQRIADMFVQDSFNLDADRKWEAITTFLEKDLKDKNFNICVTSSIDRYCPVYNAQIINSRLMDYEFIPGTTYGIINVDFATSELCEKIYMTNEPSMTNPPLESVEVYDEQTFSFLGKLYRAIFDIITKIIISSAAV